jgi:hypothetical protein
MFCANEISILVLHSPQILSEKGKPYPELWPKFLAAATVATAAEPQPQAFHEKWKFQN